MLSVTGINSNMVRSFEQYFLEKITLEYHDVLNPHIWTSGGNILSEVREHLLSIANAWAEFAEIPKSAIEDIRLTGGNANYNYTPYSDLDLHLFVDYSKVTPECPCDETIMYKYFMDRKALWAKAHKNIHIHGLPVEVYAQPVTEGIKSGQGVYSLLSDKWLQKPAKASFKLDDPIMLQKIDFLKRQIDDMVDTKSTDLEALKAMKARVRTMRGAAVQAEGEFAIENLVFKELRNTGYIKKLQDYLVSLEDEELSL